MNFYRANETYPFGQGFHPPSSRGKGRVSFPNATSNYNLSRSTQGVLGIKANPFQYLGDEEEASHLVDLKEYLASKQDKKDAVAASSSSASAQKSNSTKPTAAEILKLDPITVHSDHTEPILTLEEDDMSFFDDPKKLMEKRLGRKFFPTPQYKYRPLYEAILTYTGSVEIKHLANPGQEAKENFQYSQCFILKIYSLIDWAGPDGPLKPKSIRFPDDPHNEHLFNYWDYIQAWTYAFYYENTRQKHSWFFRFREEFWEKTKQIPLWFYHWWKIYGPPLSLLPKPIYDLYDPWVEAHPIFSNFNNRAYLGQSSCYFWADFGIPWMWKWGVKSTYDALGLPVLVRTFAFNWWHKVDVNEAVSAIKKAIQTYSMKPAFEDSTSKPDYLFKLRKSLQRRFPHASEHEIMIKCLEYFKSEFKQTFEDMSLDTVSMDTRSSQSEDPILAGEAQNPDDDLAHPEDILKAAIDLLKQAKGKDKE